MKLQDLVQSVTEKNLTKQQLEDYHTELTGLYAQMMWEMAELEKKEAVFFLENKDKLVATTSKNGAGSATNTAVRSDVEVKRMWRGTPEGQRLIELKNYEKATSKVLTSLRNRMYATY